MSPYEEVLRRRDVVREAGNRHLQILRTHRSVPDVSTNAVRLAIDLAAANAGAGQQGGIAARPVLTAGLDRPEARSSPSGKPKVYTVIVSRSLTACVRSSGAGRSLAVTASTARSCAGSAATTLAGG